MQGPDYSGFGWVLLFALVGMLAIAFALGYGVVYVAGHLAWVP